MSVLVIMDRALGHVWTSLTEDKTIPTTKLAFINYFITFDRPRSVVSDGGPLLDICHLN